MAEATWITITPDKEVYTPDDTAITFSYDQNTTPSTRLAELTFINPDAEEKHDFNPESPDGRFDYYVYQFGRRQLEVDIWTPDASNPASVQGSSNRYSGPPYVAENVWNQSSYSDSTSITIDFTTSGVNGLYQQNAEQKFRDYVQSGANKDRPFNYTMNVRVTSTAPWRITAQEAPSWLSIPSQYLSSGGFPQLRTFDNDDNVTEVTVPITVTGNPPGSSSRSGYFTLVNRQGYTKRINVTQYQYVQPNIPPTASISITNGQNFCTGTQNVSYDGSGSSDPDGTITSYAWSLGSDSGTGTTFSSSLTNNLAPVCNSTQTISGATLVVTDDRDATGSATASHTVLNKQQCEDTVSCSISCTSNPAFDGTATCSYSTSHNNNSGCGSDPSTFYSATNGLPSGGASHSGTLTRPSNITIPGRTSTVTVYAANNNVSNSCSATIQWGTPNTAPSVSATCTNCTGNPADDITTTNSSGTINLSCSVSDDDAFTLAWSGAASGTSATTTINYSGLQQGQTQSYTATCTATDQDQYEPLTGSDSITVTVSRPIINSGCRDSAADNYCASCNADCAGNLNSSSDTSCCTYPATPPSGFDLVCNTFILANSNSSINCQYQMSGQSGNYDLSQCNFTINCGGKCEGLHSNVKPNTDVTLNATAGSGSFTFPAGSGFKSGCPSQIQIASTVNAVGFCGGGGGSFSQLRKYLTLASGSNSVGSSCGTIDLTYNAGDTV